ncbi:MAG: cation:dicarboxylase symporter family transporter [Spirochaetaceae bacterium]|jgi:Na+/H+-dicarboxylate symporter|nr:cation:dicarboxylase symporter family transporter [Spirochaetaceae bacterium]
MSVWLKLLLGSLLGGLLGWFLPSDNAVIVGVLIWLQELGLRVGSYMAAPILVFSLTIAVYELRQDRLFWKVVFHTFLMITACAVFVMLAGIGVISLAPAIRIPILAVEQSPEVSLNPLETITDLFPPNMFSALTGDRFMFPLCVFAFFLGMGLSYDRSFAKPVITLIDSLSHIFYYVGAFFAEILGLVMIALAAYWSVQYRGVLQDDTFRSLIVMLGVLSLLLGFVILPLLFYFLGGKKSFRSALKNAPGLAAAGFFSGNITFTIPILFQYSKENLGVRRRLSAVSIPLCTAFCRAGSAMIAVISLAVVIQSYSSLNLELPDMFLLGCKGFVISFLLSRHPGDAAYTALAVLCLHSGKDFASGYLILKPIGFYLTALGTFLDAMIAVFASAALSSRGGFQQNK